MAWTRYQQFLVVLLVSTGSINTLAAKWTDEEEAEGSDGKKKKFNHPFFQATVMFVGEMSCMIPYKFMFWYYSKQGDNMENQKELTKGNRVFNQFILYIPAMCDMAATSIMYIGLNLTYASSFQMFRGSIIVFTGILSIWFLKKTMSWKEWIGIVFVIIGLTIVGAVDFLCKSQSDDKNTKYVIAGDLMIIIACVIASVQVVVEEKFVTDLDIPALLVVGWEGVFGFCTLACLMIPFYFFKADPPITLEEGASLENAIDALTQMGNNIIICVALFLLLISIAFFNFAGISVTKELSATTRMVLDSCRTLVIWIFSLIFFEEKFHYLQLIGFIILFIGMCMYNKMDLLRFFRKKPEEDTAE